MNYLKQLNHFYKFLPNNPLSSNAQCLYCYLLNKNNELGWIKEFTVANSIICGFTNIDRRTLDRVRNELIQKGYIEYKKGIGSRAGKYLIVQFDTQCDIQYDTQYDTQVSYNMTHNMTTLNKLNKTKIKKKNIEKENSIKKYGEFQNVFFTDEQFNKLVKTFPNDYKERIQKLDDYIQSSGKTYKDCLATLKNWARKDGYSFPEEQQNKETHEIYFNSNDLTNEQYVLYMQGKLTDEDIRKILEAKNV